jgi:hypothetical protein
MPDTAVITQLNNIGTLQVANLKRYILLNRGSEDSNVQRGTTAELSCGE